VQVDISPSTIALGGAVSVLVAALRATVPEIDKSAAGRRIAPLLPPLIASLIATLVPSTVPGVPAGERWVWGLVSTLLWSPVYTLLKRSLVANGATPTKKTDEGGDP
jgi:hypothetical protein